MLKKFANICKSCHNVAKIFPKIANSNLLKNGAKFIKKIVQNLLKMVQNLLKSGALSFIGA